MHNIYFIKLTSSRKLWDFHWTTYINVLPIYIGFFILHNPLLKDCTIWVLLWFCMPSGSQHTCSAVDTERIAEYGGETIPARFMIKLIKNWYIKTITLIIVITSLHKGFVPPASLHTILAAPCIVRYPKHL